MLRHSKESTESTIEINRERSQRATDAHAKADNPQRKGARSFFHEPKRLRTLAEKIKRKQGGRGAGKSASHERYE